MLDLIQNEFKKGNFDESKRLCLSSPNYIQNEEILNLLGLIELESNNTIKAIKYFKLTLKINPANVKTLNNIGHLLLRRKNHTLLLLCHLLQEEFPYLYSLLLYNQTD